MWKQLITWLSKTAPEEPPQQRVERVIACLRSPDRSVRIRAERVLARGLSDYSASGTEFLIALFPVLARETDPERLEIVPRYILLLASGSVVRPRSPVQAAAQACLDHWQAQQDERAQAQTLLRASEPQGGAAILLRPASGNSSVVTEELLRPSEQEAKGTDRSRDRGG